MLRDISVRLVFGKALLFPVVGGVKAGELQLQGGKAGLRLGLIYPKFSANPDVCEF